MLAHVNATEISAISPILPSIKSESAELAFVHGLHHFRANACYTQVGIVYLQLLTNSYFWDRRNPHCLKCGACSLFPWVCVGKPCLIRIAVVHANNWSSNTPYSETDEIDCENGCRPLLSL